MTRLNTIIIGMISNNDIVFLKNSFFTEILLFFAGNIILNILCKTKLGVARKRVPPLEKGSEALQYIIEKYKYLF